MNTAYPPQIFIVKDMIPAQRLILLAGITPYVESNLVRATTENVIFLYKKEFHFHGS